MCHLRLGCVLWALCLVYTSLGADIINGKEVPAHSMRFMALLFSRKVAICGGTLIHPKWVLTAAHCYNDTFRIDKVMLGVHNQTEEEKKSRQVGEVDRFFIPRCYDAQERVNDIMLIKLKKPVKITKTVKVLPLPSKAVDPAAGSLCLVAGWGRTKNKAKKGSDVLRSVNVTVIDRLKCNSKEYYNFNPTITRGHICAGSDGTNAADSCQGDSGGPLLCKGNLAGVTSFGIDCGRLKKPGVYTFLTQKQLEWIRNNIKKTL